MANAKKRWLIDYQQDREKKREYIRQNCLAQGLSDSELFKRMKDAKGKIFIFSNTLTNLKLTFVSNIGTHIPSIDGHTLIDIENIVAELQQEDDELKE